MSRNNKVLRETATRVHIQIFYIKPHWLCPHETCNMNQTTSGSGFLSQLCISTPITQVTPCFTPLRMLHHFNALQLCFHYTVIWVISCIPSVETTKRIWMGCLKTARLYSSVLYPYKTANSAASIEKQEVTTSLFVSGNLRIWNAADVL